MVMQATFDSSYNATLYEAADRDPHLLAEAIRFIRARYAFDRLTPDHIRWAAEIVRKSRLQARTAA